MRASELCCAWQIDSRTWQKMHLFSNHCSFCRYSDDKGTAGLTLSRWKPFWKWIMWREITLYADNAVTLVFLLPSFPNNHRQFYTLQFVRCPKYQWNCRDRHKLDNMKWNGITNSDKKSIKGMVLLPYPKLLRLSKRIRSLSKPHSKSSLLLHVLLPPNGFRQIPDGWRSKHQSNCREPKKSTSWPGPFLLVSPLSIHSSVKALNGRAIRVDWQVLHFARMCSTQFLMTLDLKRPPFSHH